MSSKNQQSLLISEVYKSRRTILDILEKQKYNVSEHSNFSTNEVNSMFNNDKMDMILENDDNKKIYIRYNLGSKINESIIRNLVEDLFYLSETLKKTDTLFIITKEELNDSLSNTLKQIWEKENVYIVIESIARLQFNILNHNLVPNHHIMSDNEVATMMKKYNILSFEQLPEINRFDPVAKLIGIKPKEVCEIKRPSKSAIESYYYRVCV
jgi:DNA-directed RNA polymerase subunit H (RpoH/RPB5)